MIRTDYMSLIKGYNKLSFYIGNFSKYAVPDRICKSVLLRELDRLSEEERRMLDALDVFDDVVQIAFFSILSVWLLEYNIEIAEANQITTANEWPMWLMCLPVTVSLMLMALHSVMNLIESVVDMRRIRKAGAN